MIVNFILSVNANSIFVMTVDSLIQLKFQCNKRVTVLQICALSVLIFLLILLTCRFLGYFQPQQSKHDWCEMDSDQHNNVGKHDLAFGDENSR